MTPNSPSLKFLLILTGVLLSAPALATVWNVPADAPTIAQGLQLAQFGDVVEVDCGDYYEGELFMKEGVILRQSPGPEGCVTLHGSGGTAIWFYSLESCTVQGLTFTGYGSAALRLLGSAPHIKSCRFEGNSFTDGGAIHMLGSAPYILGCTFTGNSASHAGGSIAMGDCTTTIESCVFENNSANYGGAIDVESYSEMVMTDCTVVNNSAAFQGGGLVVWRNLGLSAIVVHNSVVMDNSAPVGADGYADQGCYLSLIGSTLAPDYQYTFGGPGTVIVDDAVQIEQKSWDQVKALYR